MEGLGGAGGMRCERHFISSHFTVLHFISPYFSLFYLTSLHPTLLYLSLHQIYLPHLSFYIISLYVTSLHSPLNCVRTDMFFYWGKVRRNFKIPFHFSYLFHINKYRWWFVFVCICVGGGLYLYNNVKIIICVGI